MTNTIPNVPRELTIERDVFGAMHIKLGDFDFIQIQYQHPYTDNASTKTLAERIAALLSDPLPAGVDGMVAVKVWEADADWDDHELVVRLSAAQAIIDGLRGENERIRLNIAEYNESIACYQSERDQQAQRIGELEAALEFACKSLAQVTSSDGSGHADIAVSVLRMAGIKEYNALQSVEAYKAGAKWRIDAALSAGKDSDQ